MMQLLLWNINGVRAISKKEVVKNNSFDQFISTYDIVVLNETKINEDNLTEDYLNTHKYAFHSHSTIKRGYSGVSILSNVEPIKRLYPPFDDSEGRIVMLEFNQFILVGVYVPNSGSIDPETKRPVRIDYRTNIWDRQFRSLCKSLEKKKPIIVAGDLNVAYTNIDVHSPATLKYKAGFTDEERNNFGHLLETTDLIDVWRRKNPNKVQYTFFDYRSRARDHNRGWRIDYMLVSKSIYSKIRLCEIIPAYGSDHLPVKMIIN